MSRSRSEFSLRALRPLGVFALLTLALPVAARAEPGADCFSSPRSPLDKSAATDSCWYTLHVHAVRVSDSNPGARRAAIDAEQVARWIEKANEVYSAARVRFEFDPTPKVGDWAELHDTDVNSFSADLPGDAVWEHGKSAGNELASHFPRKVLLLFRHGPDATPTGGGFSSNSYNFVVMPGFEATTVCGPTQNSYLLAHEMGHYFGLKHTFRQFKTKAEAAAALRNAGNKPDAFDGDGLPETPPEPYIEELQCGTDALVIVNGIPFPLLRRNVMSYYASDVKTLSSEQVAVVRTWVERRFARVMAGVGPYVPDERRTFQLVSLAGGKALEAVGAPKEKGGKLRAADWSGAANQSWRIVPLTAGDTGWFEIVSVASGQCLTVESGTAVVGDRVVQGEWEGKSHQKWRFIKDEHEELVIEARNIRKVLGVGAAGGASRAGASSVDVSVDKGTTNQRWRLLPAD